MDGSLCVYGAVDKRSLVKVTFDAPYYTYNLEKKGRKKEIMTKQNGRYAALPLW